MKNEFIYQIFPQTFCEAQRNKGIGNIKGIISKLDYLKELGVTGVWISPLTMSPFKDSGYDVSDYYQINSLFGCEQDFVELIEKANQLNIKIIIDIVFNHSSSEHIWFQNALKGNKKYLNYYFFKDPINNKEPTNWKSKMGGSCWQYCENLKKYYLHLFTKDQPDFNWENDELKQEFVNILNYWLEKKVKGFRFDVCNLYSKPKIFKNDLQGDGRKFYTDGQNLESYLKFLNKNSFGKDKNIFTVGEVSSTVKEKAVFYAKNNNNEFDCVFTFLHLKVDYLNNNKWTLKKPDLDLFWKIQKEWQLYFQEHDSCLALFLNNHDQPRSISRFGNSEKYWFQSATSLFTFISLMRGIPFIYQGEEIGMTNLDFNSLNDFKDVEALGNAKDLKTIKTNQEIIEILKSKSRDNARSVMQWNDQKNAGFSNTNNLKLHINKNYKTINVFQQINDKNSILNFYKKIIKLRVNDEIFNQGTIDFFENQDYAYKRLLNNRKVIVMTNWSEKNKKINIELKNYIVIINNYKFLNKSFLKPYQVVILEKHEA